MTTTTNRIEAVALTDLVIDLDAQREVNPKRVARIADAWDPDLAGAITVGVGTDGKRYVLDGYHRVTAARAVGVEELPAFIIENVTKADRARLFVDLNSSRKAVDEETLFRVRLTAGAERETGIVQTLAVYGLGIAPAPTATKIAAVRGLCVVWDLGGAPLLGRTVKALKDAFGMYGREAWNVDLLRGVALFIKRNPTVDDDRLVKVLRKRTPDDWKALASHAARGGGGGRTTHFARILAERWNTGLSATSRNRAA
jgi:hypothetical protein